MQHRIGIQTSGNQKTIGATHRLPDSLDLTKDHPHALPQTTEERSTWRFLYSFTSNVETYLLTSVFSSAVWHFGVPVPRTEETEYNHLWGARRASALYLQYTFDRHIVVVSKPAALPKRSFLLLKHQGTQFWRVQTPAKTDNSRKSQRNSDMSATIWFPTKSYDHQIPSSSRRHCSATATEQLKQGFSIEKRPKPSFVTAWLCWTSPISLRAQKYKASRK